MPYLDSTKPVPWHNAPSIPYAIPLLSLVKPIFEAALESFFDKVIQK
jgi:hypothetical protein